MPRDEILSCPWCGASGRNSTSFILKNPGDRLTGRCINCGRQFDGILDDERYLGSTYVNYLDETVAGTILEGSWIMCHPNAPYDMVLTHVYRAHTEQLLTEGIVPVSGRRIDCKRSIVNRTESEITIKDYIGIVNINGEVCDIRTTDKVDGLGTRIPNDRWLDCVNILKDMFDKDNREKLVDDILIPLFESFGIRTGDGE